MQGEGESGSEREPTEKVLAEIEMLRRHIEMLKAVKEDEPIGIIMLSEKLGIPQHRVRYSLRLLEMEGVISPSARGAQVTGDVAMFKSKVRKTLAQLGQECKEIEKCLDRI